MMNASTLQCRYVPDELTVINDRRNLALERIFKARCSSVTHEASFELQVGPAFTISILVHGHQDADLGSI